ncbi:MAG: tripartite tricarboxylate transporter permease [Salinarimonadaceae bacterium]|nr:MAG: tripartite tricarboxylate transporter permease [Salinarimonadaceae bacterium]
MVSIGDTISNIGIGLSFAISPEALVYCFLGVTLGTFIGVLPGVGVLATVSILLPFTFYVDPKVSLIMLAGIYYGAAYGGSTASILLNMPGTSSSAITCLDGYPMTKQGRGGIALFMTAIASFAGSFIGILMLAAFAPPLAGLARSFGSQEYVALMVLGLLAASLLSTSSAMKSLVTVVFGLLLGIVGIDVNSGQPRLTYGFTELQDGIALVGLALGLFGVPEVIANAGRIKGVVAEAKGITLRSMLPTREDWRRSWKPMLRGTGIGSFFGALPGTGGMIASFMSYALEKRLHKDPSQFGKGAVEGVAAPEASNNAAVQTAFIPTLTLGIPGDPVMAILLGVMMIHGIAPGPSLVNANPEVFWGLVVSFLIGNIILLILNIPLIGIWVRLISIPYNYLYPAIVVFLCIGVFSINNSVFDLYMVIFFGLVGYFMVLLRFEPAPLILGFILGPLLEENFRRSLVLSRGDMFTFFERPVSGSIFLVAFLLVAWIVIAELRNRYLARKG